MANLRLCSIPNCGKPVECRGWCESHYNRWRRYGDPLAGRISRGECSAWVKRHASFASDECLPWPYSKTYRGYGKLQLNRRQMNAHHYMCILAHGPQPSPEHEAAHDCGNSSCVNPNHLRWATHSSNIADKIDHGTHQIGEKHGMAKITEEDVRKIRALRGVMTQPEIGALFGITFSMVSRIQLRKSWQHVSD